MYLIQINVSLYRCGKAKEKANRTMYDKFGIHTKYDKVEYAEQWIIIVW